MSNKQTLTECGGMIKKVRNEQLDIIRGVAAILVISGHVIMEYENASQNILLNFITTIQMPLFMMVAGYAVGYSKPITSPQIFKSFIKKRTTSLLLPWFVWSALFYIFLGDQPIIEYLCHVAYKMEAAYWFLFSLWTIDLIFGFSSLIAANVSNRNQILFTTLTCGFFNCFLLFIGYKVGVSFLGIKYTTYYLIFFLCGWFCKILQDKYQNWRSLKILQYINVVLLLIFAISLSKVQIFYLPETPFWILFRLVISLIGSLVVFYYCQNTKISSIRIKSFIIKCSNYSLELYIVQLILLNLLAKTDGMSAMTTFGLINMILYTIIILFLSLFVIKILNSSEFSRFFFWGKSK